MSSKEDGDGSAPGTSSHVQDVSGAWDRLLEAKHVLQRIENKVDIQNQRRKQAQKIRRRLHLERDSFSGLNSCSSAVNVLKRQQIYESKPDETFTLYSETNFSSKMDTPWDLSSRTRPTAFLQDDKPSVVSSHRYYIDSTHEDLLAKSSQERFGNDQVVALRGFSEEHVDQGLKTSDLLNQTYLPEDEMEEIVNPYLAVTFPSPGTHITLETRPRLSPDTVTPTPSPKIDLQVQKLEHLKSRSPKNKLEKLKEKIQEQKKRQDLLKRNSTKSHQSPEPLCKPAIKRKVYKVTFGPPAPGCKDEESVPVYSEEDTVKKREIENFKKKSHKNKGNTASRFSREKSRPLMSKSPVTRKLSFKSLSPERKVNHSGLYGASAWREGQKLVQQILGPSPVTVLKRHSSKADDPHIRQKGSGGRCQKMGSPDSLKHKQQPNTHKLVKRKIDSARVIPEISAEEQQSRPVCKMSGKSGEKTGYRAKHFSPKRPHATSNNMEKMPLGKENVGDNRESQPNSSKRGSYSVEQIRDFMKKKAIERQKMERANQTKMKKALQIRKEQLDNVLKKQKEAFPPKRGGTDTAVSCKNIQIRPGEVENVRKNLSEWLHVTSNDLLREDNGASATSKKQKTEILLKDELSSPLRLQDLAPVLTISQGTQVKDINSSKGLNDDALPSRKTADNLPQCKSHQQRLHAIWTTAKDLGRRVELECNRLGSPNLSHHSGTSVSSPSPCSPSQMTSASGKYPNVVETVTDQRGNPPVNKLHISPTSVYASVCWAADSEKFSTGPLKKDRHSVKNESTENKTSQAKKLYPKILSQKAEKSDVIRRSAGTSPHRASDVSSRKLPRETSLSPPRRKPASPRKAASPPYSGKKGKREIPHSEKSSSPVMRMEIASKIKAQFHQQEKDLAALRLKAEMEAKEAQRCLEMLRCSNQQTPGLKTSSSDKQGNRNNSRGQESENDRFGAGLEGRLELDKHGTDNVTQQNSPVTSRGTMSAAHTDMESLEQSWDHTEPATDSTSKWSEVGEFYGSLNMFTRFTLEMSQQYLREEELRARHQTALLRLREEALKEKTKAELALLHHQKIYWETKNEPGKVEEILRQEHEMQRNLKEEQAEIKHLQNIYKAAHQERKLLLRQQKEILRIQQSAAQLQQKLHNSGVTLQVSELIDLDPSTQQSRYNTLHDSTLASEHLNQDTQSAISDLSEDNGITEKTQTMETYQAQKDESTSPVPEVLRRSDPQSKEAAEEKSNYIPDETTQGNSLSGDGAQVVGSSQDNLTSPWQTSPTTQEDLSSHSQEEISSANQKEVEIFVNMQDTDRVTAGEPRNNLSLKAEDKKREPVEDKSSEEPRQDPKIIPATQEAACDDHLVTEPIHDHSSQSISASSKSETVALSPSLAEFQKVSAKLINISESSISASDRGQGGEDTESGDSEVFDLESSDFPPVGPLDKVLGGNMINRDEESLNRDIMSDEDKSISFPAKPPDSRKPVVLVMKETQSKTEMAPLACESFPTSEDLTESDTKTHGINHLAENQDGSVVRITDLQKSTSMSPEDDGNAAGMSSPDTKDRQRVTETNEKQSFTESAIFKKIEMMPFHATTSKDLFQIKSFPHRSEGDIIFITDEVLQPIEDTLSEILSPVDEKLSYESADLYSPQEDQSEELPSLPRDSGSIKSGDSDTEDFPTPPEEILLSRSESLQSSREASLIDEIHLLYDSLLTDDTLLPPDEFIMTENSPLETDNSRRSPEVVKPCRPFLTLSKAEDGVHDPLSSFEIGDRVLVKLSKPGTLMYKGLTSFKEGYWAGVALNKPEGDNDGTYEGIRYFECPKNCGVFVRPGQISHLLFDDVDGSDPQKDEDDDYSFGDGPSHGDVQPQDEGGETSNRQHRGRDKGQKSSEKDTNQSRSCSLETSENINDLQDADISPRCLHTLPEEPIVESKNPGQALQIKQFCSGDTNKLIVPNPPQDDKHRLLLKVTDELISRVLCDAIGTYSKISAPEKESVMNSSKDEDDKCMGAEEGFCNQLPSTTTREAGGYVDTLVTEVINDCIKEYKKIRRKKGKDNMHQSSTVYSSPFLVSREDRTTPPLCGHRTSVLINFTDGIFEELIKDSLQVIANINLNRAQYCGASRGVYSPSR